MKSKISYGIVYIVPSSDDVNFSRVFVLLSPTFLYQNIIMKNVCTLNINSDQEYSHLYDAMFASQIKGYSRIEIPKGRKDAIDGGNSQLTQLREFIEETGGYYHPTQFKTNKYHEISEVIRGYDKKTYTNYYSIHIDPRNELIKYDDGGNLAEFILKYINKSHDENAQKYINRYKYIKIYDSLKYPDFVYLKDLTCLLPHNKEVIKEVVKRYIKKNNE